jgi:hypothetical protein
MVRRAFIGAERPLSTSELMRRCYPRTVKFRHWHSYNVRRAAVKFAVPAGRARTWGTPIIWKPNAALMRKIRGE